MKSTSASEAIFFGSLNSMNKIMAAVIWSSADNLSVANLLIYIPSVPAGGHPKVLFPIGLLWTCTLACSLKC